MLRKLGKKVQAALEFLMSYSWAILVVLAAIAALAYFGVLSPEKFLPEKCILSGGIACLDYRVESYRAVLVLQNSLGDSITIDEVSIYSNGLKCQYNDTTVLNNNEKAIFAIEQCDNGQAGKKFDGTMDVIYTISGQLKHKIVGELRTKIVEGSSISSQSVCQNAENNALCDGLDIAFGIGYKNACCSEYNLCCP